MAAPPAVQYAVTKVGSMLMLWQNTSGFGTSVNGDAGLLCEWDTAARGQPGDEYARQIVHKVVSLLGGGGSPARILLLGLGCGTITAGILCSSSARAGAPHVIEAFDAVELSEQVLELEEAIFFPAIEGSEMCAGEQVLRERVHKVHGDALRLHDNQTYSQMRGTPYTHVVVDLPQVYAPSGHATSASFWAGLGTLTIGEGASLVVNSWYGLSAHGGALRHDLLWGGWGELHEERVYDTDIKGASVYNMVVTARDWWPWYSPSRWTRFVCLRCQSNWALVVGVVLIAVGLLAFLLLFLQQEFLAARSAAAVCNPFRLRIPVRRGRHSVIPSSELEPFALGKGGRTYDC